MAKTPPKAKKGRGRPPTPPDTLAKQMHAVCDRVAKGELVRHASKAEGITEQRVRELGLTDQYSSLYARARESQAHALAEQAIEIADGEDALTEWYEEAIADREVEIAAMPEGKSKSAAYKTLAALRSNVVARDRMRMDARKWLTSKIAPKLYGDKLDVTTDGKALSGVIVLPASK